MPINFFLRPGSGRPPHQAIPAQILRVISEAIVKGWEVVRTDPPVGFDLAKSDEDTVTVVLHNILVNRILYANVVPGFTPDLFRVSREPKVYSHDASSIEKMPDLFFHLISDRKVAFPDQDGVYAECKPIGVGKSIGQHYCDAGISRFVKGEYAWTMQEGMMIGYASPKHQLPADLAKFLKRKDRQITMPLVAGPTAIQKSSATTYSQVPHATTHRRNFKYRDTGKDAPDIVIHHLWLLRA
jgi:hypothetical protein